MLSNQSWQHFDPLSYDYLARTHTPATKRKRAPQKRSVAKVVSSLMVSFSTVVTVWTKRVIVLKQVLSRFVYVRECMCGSAYGLFAKQIANTATGFKVCKSTTNPLSNTIPLICVALHDYAIKYSVLTLSHPHTHIDTCIYLQTLTQILLAATDTLIPLWLASSWHRLPGFVNKTKIRFVVWECGVSGWMCQSV